MTPSSIPEISPPELARTIESGEKLQIVDVRSPAGVSAGKIEFDRFHNIPGSVLLSRSSLDGTGIDPDIPAVVVCGHGNDSKVVTAHLLRLGINARSLVGGMAAWMMLLLPRKLDPPPATDSLIQFDRPGKGALSYVLISAGEAIVIDASRNLRPYLDHIENASARLVAVADTHVHADYISGGPAIAREYSVPYFLHPDDAIFPYDGTPGRLEVSPVHDGMTIKVGACSLSVRATPGHSPGSVTYFAGEEAAFTGDFLFLLSVGRPDLAGKTEAWAPHLWESIQRATGSWPPHAMIYPAHYSGQEHRLANHAIGASLDVLLRHNSSLGKKSKPEFVNWVKQMDVPFPAAYRTIKAINVGLSSVGELEADELEIGKNECALGGR
jgi:glyoxylase-like metal-dependent hydrolase (beta-lactamase superfamily II)